MSPAEKKYQEKIKTPEELREIIGPLPRKKRIIMCHGTFDLVHPGHIRHLLYASQHADLVLASVTADIHITKSNLRPYVPEQLRAMNLAALECVDYVIIDNNPTPLENLANIQPDFFAKGYEYGSEGLHPKTAEEKEVVEAYGGKLIFSPGDIVYSSSSIIDTTPPNLSAEKLSVLMEAENISFDDLRQALDKIKGKKVHVVGDTIVDSYTHCTLIGGMTKTPTSSVRYERREDFSGGAAIVAKHLSAAGAEVDFSTVLGNDALKDQVLDDLKESGVRCKPVIDPERPTTNKNVFIAGGYRLLKVDVVDNRTISEQTVKHLAAAVSATTADAVIFCDFRHGIFNQGTIPQLIDAIPQGPYRVADSQVATRWGNILEFKGFDLITPNEREARFALGDQDSVIRPLASKLYDAAKCKTLMLKLGARGMITCRTPFKEAENRSFFVLDSFTGNLVDAVGAGDALLAYATLGMIATGSEVIASTLGSFAAAIECECDGNVPVRADDVRARIDRIEQRLNYC